jgi:phosphatidylserine/phosphatidylglycerophosphate/cardiolipin synthase-like enzyme
MGAVAELRGRLQKPDGVRRMGQALWMLVGEQINASRLLWARGLAEPVGDELLQQALREAGAIGPDGRLMAAPLAGLLTRLWASSPDEDREPSLVWTLPPGIASVGVAPDGYVKAVVELILEAQMSLTLVSPYLEVRGIGRLQAALLSALQRGVHMRLFAQDLHLSSQASAALEDLRQETRSAPGRLIVYESDPTVLMHLKAVIADDARAVIGSANVTHSGFGSNLELGVTLGASAAMQISQVIQAAINLGVVRRVFSNGAVV